MQVHVRINTNTSLNLNANITSFCVCVRVRVCVCVDITPCRGTREVTAAVSFGHTGRGDPEHRQEAY